MSELVVVCLKWDGWRRVFEAQQVNALYRMCQQHIRRPHRFVCITDKPKGIKCETMPIWENPCRIPGRDNFRKLRLFSEAEYIGERVMYLDLDTLIRDDITHLTEYEDDFVICKGRGARYNSSYFLLKAGQHRHVWDSFNPARSPHDVRKSGFVGTDQAWMSMKIQDARTVGMNEGVMMYGKGNTDISRARIVFFPVPRKPWQMDRTNPDVYLQYMSYAS